MNTKKSKTFALLLAASSLVFAQEDDFAGPQECTALGNIMMQAKSAGDVDGIFDMRRIIADSVIMTRFEPQDKELWDEAYKKYLEIVNIKD